MLYLGDMSVDGEEPERHRRAEYRDLNLREKSGMLRQWRWRSALDLLPRLRFDLCQVSEKERRGGGEGAQRKWPQLCM